MRTVRPSGGTETLFRAQVVLDVELVSFSQPENRFLDDGHVQMAVTMGWVLLPLSVLGVPLDWGDAEARVQVRALEPEFRQPVGQWSASASASDAAGLYYGGWPLAKALRQAADEIIVQMRKDLPAIETELTRLDSWYSVYGLADRQALRAVASAPALIRAAGDSDPSIRLRAVAALGLLEGDGPGIDDRLALALTDAEAAVRRKAADGLAARNATQDRIRKVLGELRGSDPDAQVRSSANRAWRRLRFSAWADALGADSDLAGLIRALGDPAAERRREAIYQLGQKGQTAKAAAPALLGALDDPDPLVRIEALEALGTIDAGTQQVITKFDALLVGEPDQRVRQTARRVLRRLKLLSPKPEDSAPIPAAASVDLGASRAGIILAVVDILDASRTGAARPRPKATIYLDARLAERCRYRTVPRSQIRQRLQGHKRASYQACYDEACQIELGKALAAQQVLSTRLLPADGGCVLTASLYDLRTETAEAAATVDAACTVEGLVPAVDALVDRLCPASSR